jgi:hypothetical protein
LQGFDVVPGIFTTNQLRLQEDQSLKDAQPGLQEEQIPFASTMNDSFDRLSMEDDDKLKPAFVPSAAPPSTPPTRKPPRRSSMNGSVTPIFSPIRSGVMAAAFSPASVAAAASPAPLAYNKLARDGTSLLLARAFANQDGTRQHPYICKANYAFPERNPSIDIELVPGVQYNDHMHTAFVIRKTVDPEDFHHYEATIPPIDCFPSEYGLENRLILLRCPSQSCWKRDTESFYPDDHPAEEPCKAAHVATELQIEADETNRKYFFWLIVFEDEEVSLDNSMFSGDDHDGIIRKMLYPIKKKHVESGKMFTTMALVWKIGVAGYSRRMKRREKEVTPLSLKDLYK